MSAAIWVILILLALGMVVESLLRLRKYLNDSPPVTNPQEPSDEDD